MGKYLQFWRRGWWAFLLLLAINIPLGLLAMLLERMFGTETMPYNIAALSCFLVFGLPFSGWIFEQFAQRSERLSQRHPSSPDAA